MHIGIRVSLVLRVYVDLTFDLRNLLYYAGLYYDYDVAVHKLSLNVCVLNKMNRTHSLNFWVLNMMNRRYGRVENV